MSFDQQEKAMRDLLFDQTLRERFAKQGVQALSAFELTEEEKNDFLTIRVKALNVDAGMRVYATFVNAPKTPKP